MKKLLYLILAQSLLLSTAEINHVLAVSTRHQPDAFGAIQNILRTDNITTIRKARAANQKKQETHREFSIEDVANKANNPPLYRFKVTLQPKNPKEMIEMKRRDEWGFSFIEVPKGVQPHEVETLLKSGILKVANQVFGMFNGLDYLTWSGSTKTLFQSDWDKKRREAEQELRQDHFEKAWKHLQASNEDYSKAQGGNLDLFFLDENMAKGLRILTRMILRKKDYTQFGVTDTELKRVLRQADAYLKTKKERIRHAWEDRIFEEIKNSTVTQNIEYMYDFVSDFVNKKTAAVQLTSSGAIVNELKQQPNNFQNTSEIVSFIRTCILNLKTSPINIPKAIQEVTGQLSQLNTPNELAMFLAHVWYIEQSQKEPTFWAISACIEGIISSGISSDKLPKIALEFSHLIKNNRIVHKAEFNDVAVWEKTVEALIKYNYAKYIGKDKTSITLLHPKFEPRLLENALVPSILPDHRDMTTLFERLKNNKIVHKTEFNDVAVWEKTVKALIKYNYAKYTGKDETSITWIHPKIRPRLLENALVHPILSEDQELNALSILHKAYNHDPEEGVFAVSSAIGKMLHNPKAIANVLYALFHDAYYDPELGGELFDSVIDTFLKTAPLKTTVDTLRQIKSLAHDTTSDIVFDSVQNALIHRMLAIITQGADYIHQEVTDLAWLVKVANWEILRDIIGIMLESGIEVSFGGNPSLTKKSVDRAVKIDEFMQMFDTINKSV